MEGIERTLLVTLILLVPAIQAQDSSVSSGLPCGLPVKSRLLCQSK